MPTPVRRDALAGLSGDSSSRAAAYPLGRGRRLSNPRGVLSEIAQNYHLICADFRYTMH